MKNLWKRGSAVLGAIAISAAGMMQAHAQQTFGWAPKPAQLTPYTGVNRPLTKLSDVIANRNPAVSWRQPIVVEENVTADYVGMKVGDETRPTLSADHRTAFIVWAGDIEVTIQGQPTFMAKKGTMIQVPHRNEYKLKNVGTTPSLHFEIYVTDKIDLYPQNSATLPPPPTGESWYLSRIEAPDVWTRPGQSTKPVFRHYLDSPSAQEFVNNDRLFVNAIRGNGPQNIPPDTDLGHFHVYGGEFWFIIEGTMGYLIEGMPYFTATPGDVVYAAKGRWHRAGNHAQSGAGTRVAINGYPRGAHLWQQTNPPAVPPVQVMSPWTRAKLSSMTSSGSYLQPTVTLSGYPDANSPTDDLDYSEYWLDGAAQPTRYAGPFQISGSGMHTLSYRSVDKAGNVEPPKTLAVGVIDLPPLALQVVPSTLNLRTAGLVTTVISVPAGYDLRQWGVSDVRAEGTPAVSAAYSADGRTIVATFNKAALASVPAGTQVKITVTGQFNYNGAQAPMMASTQVQVIR